MRYEISVRQPTTEDANRDCLFHEVDIEDYEIHLRALAEDISNLSDVDDATISDGKILIETNLDEQSIKAKAEPLFRREFCYVRYVTIRLVA